MTSTNGEYRPPTENLPIFDNSVFSYWDGFLTLREFYKFIYTQVVGIYATLTGNNIFTGHNIFSELIEGTCNSSIYSTYTGNISSELTNLDSNYFPYFSNDTVSNYKPLFYDLNFYYNANSNTLTCPNISGTITNSNNILITSDNNNGTYFIPFVKTSGNDQKPLFIDDTTTPLTYNPSTSNLSATTFTGSLSGNATSATTATNADNILLTSDNTSGTYYIPFSKFAGSTTARSLFVDDTTTRLTYNPNTSNLSASTFTGSLSGNATTATTASNSNNILVTTDTTNNTYYLPFIKSLGTGNKALYVEDETTNLTFNPNTGLLQTTNIQVLNKNILSNCLNITSNYTLTTSSPEYIFINSSSAGFTINLPSVTDSNIGLKFSIHCNTAEVTTINVPAVGGYYFYGSLEYNQYSYINMSKFNTLLGGVVCANFIEIVFIGNLGSGEKVWAIIGGSADVYASYPNIFTGQTNTFKSNLILQDDNSDIPPNRIVTISTKTTNFENTVVSPYISTVNFKNSIINYTCPTINYNNPVGTDQTINFKNTYINFENSSISQIVNFKNSQVNFNNPTGGNQTITYNNTTTNFNNPTGGNQTITFDNTNTYFNNVIKIKEQFIYSAYNTIIEVNTTISQPLYQYYSFYCSGGVDITLTLPNASYYVGITLTFLRIQQTSPNYNLYSATSNIYDGGSVSNVICNTGNVMCQIASVSDSSGYNWYIINKR
jgi:hypothetical protein